MEVAPLNGTSVGPNGINLEDLHTRPVLQENITIQLPWRNFNTLCYILWDLHSTRRKPITANNWSNSSNYYFLSEVSRNVPRYDKVLVLFYAIKIRTWECNNCYLILYECFEVNVFDQCCKYGQVVAILMLAHTVNRNQHNYIADIGKVVFSETVANCEALYVVRRHLRVRRTRK